MTQIYLTQSTIQSLIEICQVISVLLQFVHKGQT